ncbi:hypothetical protein FNYG_13158 [Fusarium nygamai]|uniref:Uncharacterized protein n=1 Tax=Gibberella nygamai TaxID=42673 RepID=A0A2K0VU01_GIBNY|nr:hypothetical protein FNYG_13158 [Fusarium nygamai]
MAQGLHVIFDSSHDGSPPRDDEIDVISVPGLNFTGSSDHARETWTVGEKLWLKDFLPSSLQKPARVMLFEYNSSPVLGAATIKIDDHAKNLLQWLILRRKASSSSPTFLQRDPISLT